MTDAGHVLVVGASSAIGRAIALRFARKGSVLVAGRDAKEIDAVAADARIRTGATVTGVAYDAMTTDAAAFFARCLEIAQGNLDGIVVCHGLMDEEDRAKNDPNALARIIGVNFTSPAAVLTAAAGYFENRKRGFLVGVGSVAGDRGRQSNYPYGAAKAGFATWLDGLRHRLFKAGVTVTTVKPGFVDTGMTWGMKGLFLVASPEKIAADVERAVRKKRAVIYTPWFWRGLLAVIRSVPRPIFLRSKL